MSTVWLYVKRQRCVWLIMTIFISHMFIFIHISIWKGFGSENLLKIWPEYKHSCSTTDFSILPILKFSLLRHTKDYHLIFQKFIKIWSRYRYDVSEVWYIVHRLGMSYHHLFNFNLCKWIKYLLYNAIFHYYLLHVHLPRVFL